MNRDTKATVLPALTIDLLKEEGFSVENAFTELWRRMGVKTILNRSGFTKRSGTSIHKVIYALSLWLWLRKGSIGMFAREDLQGIGKDVLYDTLNREDLNWRRHHEHIACKAVQTFRSTGKKAFVLDGAIVRRFGRKMPGISYHFDHTTGRHVMGQQMLTLGLAGEEGFVPLDSELFISQSKAQSLPRPFRDRRNAVAKHYRAARSQSKLEMAFCMLVIAKSIYNGANVAQMRLQSCDNSTEINYVSKLWKVFRAIMSGALDELKTVLGDTIVLIQKTIDAHIQCFFVQSLQLDPKTLRLEAL